MSKAFKAVMGKEKKAKIATDDMEVAPEEAAPAAYISVIANPLADGKLSKKLYKLVKKAAKRKQIKRGVKEVIKAVRKNVKG